MRKNTADYIARFIPRFGSTFPSRIEKPPAVLFPLHHPDRLARRRARLEMSAIKYTIPPITLTAFNMFAFTASGFFLHRAHTFPLKTFLFAGIFSHGIE